jgi:hypothetical protein
MTKTYVIYKGRRIELNEFRTESRLIEGMEQRFLYCRYKEKEYIAKTVAEMKGMLEEVLDAELNSQGGK